MSTTNKQLTIAIDGHSSCGKSTVAKSLSKILKYTYIDSGAMYRAVTLFCMNNNLINNDIVDTEKLNPLLDSIKIHFTFDTDKQQYLTWLNDELIEDEIREIEVSNNVSIVSKIDFVRDKLVKLQQSMGQGGGIVMDGRDIGTVVFPDAELKIFMNANAEIRATRRYEELLAKGDDITFEEILENVQKRDLMDTTRVDSPLVKAKDAIEVDNSELNQEDQFTIILQLAKDRIAGRA